MDSDLSTSPTDDDPEVARNRAAAILSLAYLLAMLAFFLWLAFDTWIGRYTLANLLGYGGSPLLDTSLFKLVAYTFTGGALGGVLNGIRSVIKWHSDENVFHRRYIWKYVVLPWQGATLALVAFALIGSGMAVFGGEINLDQATARQALSVFAIGVLAGYGSRDVSIWLDAQVTRLFRVRQPAGKQIPVPDLAGQSLEEAQRMLQEAGLQLGQVRNQPTADHNQVGVVVAQEPEPNTLLEAEGSVVITVGVTTPE